MSTPGQFVRFACFISILLIAACDSSEKPQPEIPATPATDIASGPEGGLASIDDLVSRTGQGIDVNNHPGKQLFEKNCLVCHDGRVPKAPAAVWLEMMAPDALLNVMRNGIMSAQAAHLTSDEQLQVAEYITRTSLADYVPPLPLALCATEEGNFDGSPPARVGWGHNTSRFVPADIAGITRADVSDLRLKWAFAYPDALRARSQPAIGWNTIFVGSQDGTVYALNLDTGCPKWRYRAPAEVRTAIVIDPTSERLYFGDVHGRVYSLMAKTGELVWQVKVDDHANATVTGTPSLGKGQLFVPISSLEVTSAADPGYACCTFIGSVVALDLETGEQHWKTHTVTQTPTKFGETSVGTAIIGPSGAPVWNSPAFDAKRNRIYFGSGENYSSPADENSDAIFAIDAETGKRIWMHQFTRQDAWNVGCVMGNENCPSENGPDYDFGASAIIASINETTDVLVVGQKSGDVYGMNIDTGDVIWNQRLGRGGTSGGVHFGMASDGQTVYVPINDMDGTGGDDISLYGAGLHAIEIATGKVLWRNFADNICGEQKHCDPGISAAITATAGMVFAGHLDGRFRAYAADTGTVLWEYDTRQPVKTTSGLTASGGSISGSGPAMADGHVVLNSGYGLYNHMPGNLLLVFEVTENK